MKYIKAYEYAKKSEYYWFIWGDYKTFCDVVKEFLYPKQYEHFLRSSDTYKFDESVVGGFITQNSKKKDGYLFWICHSLENMKEAEEYFEFEGDIIAGELKLIDNKLVKDTLYRDIRKYNI